MQDFMGSYMKQMKHQWTASLVQGQFLYNFKQAAFLKCIKCKYIDGFFVCTNKVEL